MQPGERTLVKQCDDRGIVNAIVRTVQFTYSILSAQGNHWRAALATWKNARLDTVKAAGGARYGIWYPHFGLPTNTLIIMYVFDDPPQPPAGVVSEALGQLDGIADVTTRTLIPTARPVAGTPPDKKGLYVHRWFRIKTEHMHAFVELSEQAWATFESRFAAQIQGLFREEPPEGDETQLLLLTWYDSFATWQASRDPAKDRDAWPLFLRRHELTLQTEAHATDIVFP